jgi:hypothetical protein
MQRLRVDATELRWPSPLEWCRSKRHTGEASLRVGVALSVRRWQILQCRQHSSAGDAQIFDEPFVNVEISLVFALISDLITFGEHASHIRSEA